MEALSKAGSGRRPFKTQISQFNWGTTDATISVYPVGPDKGSVITHFAIEVVGEEQSTMTGRNVQSAVPGHVVVTG